MDIELSNEELKLINNALNDRRNILEDDLKNLKNNPNLQWLVRDFERQIEVIENLLEDKLP